MKLKLSEDAGNAAFAAADDLVPIVREVLDEIRRIREDLREISENRLIAADVNWED